MVIVKVRIVWELQFSFLIEFISLNDIIAQEYLICKDTRQWYSRCVLVNFAFGKQKLIPTNSH